MPLSSHSLKQMFFQIFFLKRHWICMTSLSQLPLLRDGPLVRGLLVPRCGDKLGYLSSMVVLKVVLSLWRPNQLNKHDVEMSRRRLSKGGKMEIFLDGLLTGDLLERLRIDNEWRMFVVTFCNHIFAERLHHSTKISLDFIRQPRIPHIHDGFSICMDIYTDAIAIYYWPFS